jgi:hypothetical protein
MGSTGVRFVKASVSPRYTSGLRFERGTMPRPGQDEFTREELRRMAWLYMFVPDPISMLLREFGTHTESSWKMAWANLKGEMHPSRLMQEVAAELDADPGFAGWRDR